MMKLFMVMLGCKPKGRLTEQHDIYFGIANNLKELVPYFKDFWPESEGVIHIDAWREITKVNDFSIEIIERTKSKKEDKKLFFINLGGYKINQFDEFHYKLLEVAASKTEAISAAKKTQFFKEYNFKGGESHIDDKYGLDVDDIFSIEDALDVRFKKKYKINMKINKGLNEDELHIGYVNLKKLK